MKKYFSSSVWRIPFIAFAIVTLACGTVTQTSAPVISTRTPLPIISATSQSSSILEKTPVNPPPSPTSTKTKIPLTPKPTNTRVPPTSTPVPALYLGDASQEGGYALTALAVNDPAQPAQFYTPETGKKVVSILFDVSNISGDWITVEAGDITLLDAEGFAYPYDIWSIDGYLDTTDLSAGEQVRGLVGYSIPEAAIPSKIKISKETIFGSSYQLQASLLPAPEGYTPVTITITPTIPTSNLGDVVEQSGYSITATNIEDPANQGISSEPTLGYKWVAVEIVLSNVSAADVLSVYPGRAYLVDNNGYIYAADEYYGKEGQIQSIDLSAGERAKGWVSFLIPEDAVPLYLKYEFDIWNDSNLVTGLSQ